MSDVRLRAAIRESSASGGAADPPAVPPGVQEGSDDAGRSRASDRTSSLRSTRRFADRLEPNRELPYLAAERALRGRVQDPGRRARCAGAKPDRSVDEMPEVESAQKLGGASDVGAGGDFVLPLERL